MSKGLTKNARWIILWAKTNTKDIPYSIPTENVYNIGRFSYDVTTIAALNDTLDFSKDNVLASMVYEIDVSILPYAKQWREASKIAVRYFEKQLGHGIGYWVEKYDTKGGTDEDLLHGV